MSDVFFLTANDDAFIFADRQGSVFAQGGDDTVTGNGGNNRIGLGTGDDVAQGGGGNDVIWGNAGKDDIDGGAGNDTLYHGAGDDVVRGGAGNDIIYGGPNISPNSGADDVDGGAGNDTIYAGDMNDTLTGGEGNDVIGGGAGDDTIYMDGNDTVYGGDGEDTAYLAGNSGDYLLTINGTGVFEIAGNGATQNIFNVEKIVTADGAINLNLDLSNLVDAGLGDILDEVGLNGLLETLLGENIGDGGLHLDDLVDGVVDVVDLGLTDSLLDDLLGPGGLLDDLLGIL